MFLLMPAFVYGQVRLPKLIADGMVLQRNAQVRVWGWAAANEKVTLQFMGKTHEAVANKDGNWALMLTGLQAGGPYTMTIKASNTITLQNILVGDVWLCSGQSNMELPMRRVWPLYQQEIESADNTFIRYFEVPQVYNFNTPVTDLASGQWKPVSRQTIESFSAVAYFFAKDLYQKYKVPVGLINASLGGSPAEAWMSEEALKAFPSHYDEAQRFKDASHIEQIVSKDQARINAWYKELRQKDKGYQEGQKWSDPELSTAGWETMQIPGYWADTRLGGVNGVLWFRKDIQLPAGSGNKAAFLNLGTIVDSDSVFVNGQFVGTTSYQYPPRWYNIPKGVLKEGRNTIAIRIVNETGRGGFVPDKPYVLEQDGQKTDLKGEWQFKVGATMQPLAGQTFVRWKPVGLYNGMISPITNYSIKGVIWYQGESNAGRPVEYASLFPAMIKDWRKQWGQGDFPFIYVQLTNFMKATEQPTESNWALLREAQRNTLTLPNTAMAVTIDIGEWNDIHPLNKRDVGHRLALAAQKVAYGEKVVYSGPTYQSMSKKGNKVVLTFNNTGSGLVAQGGPLKQFAIAGPDKKFVWANARLEGNRVVVWSDQVPNPVAVRYAWADNPAGANLYNKEGLPASPFTTETEFGF